MGLWQWPWWVLVVAWINWWAVATRRRVVEYVAKPATLALLIFWFALRAEAPTLLAVIFGLGLVGGLVGDICLMLPKRFFITGLVAFLLGHLAYIMAFSLGSGPFSWVSVGAAVPLTVYALGMGRRLFAGLRQKGLRKLRGPVVAYLSIILLMTLAALSTLTRPEWAPAAAGWVSLGAVLFVVSDSVLAWDRFVQKFYGGRFIVMVTYHLAQVALAVGVVLQLGGSI